MEKLLVADSGVQQRGDAIRTAREYVVERDDTFKTRRF